MNAQMLQGRRALVTGSTQGIGLAVAEALAAQGCSLVLHGLASPAEVEAVQAAVRAAGAPAVQFCGHDLAQPAQVESLMRSALAGGPLDILVNNAGIMPLTPLDEEADASVTRQLEINLHAVIFGTQEAMRRMRPRDTGHIVNIASLAGRAAGPGIATYCATKHGVIGLSEAVRAELRGTGVEVTVVMPGFAATELAAGVPDLRFVPRVTPEDIAAATVAALKVPRFDVWVPKRLAGIIAVAAVLPRPLREWVARAMNSQKVVHADRAQRAAYEARAAASAPHADEAAFEEETAA
jgi:short-subunit dehydrogenase